MNATETTTVTRYAITHINRDGMRTLALPNQGRNHFDTSEAASEFLQAMRQNNGIDRLRSLYPDVESLAVKPVTCYRNGDAVGIFFDE